MKKIFMLATVIMVLCCGPEQVGEDAFDSPLKVSIECPGWPDSVAAIGCRILFSPVAGYRVRGLITLTDSSGTGQSVSAVLQPDMYRYAIEPAQLGWDRGYRMAIPLVSEDGSTNIFHTNFRTAGGNGSGMVPTVIGIWPANGSCDVQPGDLRIVCRFSVPVFRDGLTLLLTGCGEYRYLPVVEKGYGNSVTAVAGDALQPDANYQIFISGIRSAEGIQGQCGSIRFTTTATQQQQPVRLLFSQVCPEFRDLGSGIEFLEFHNPCSRPVDLQEKGLRLYRNCGSGWKLVCDFSDPTHFSRINRSAIIPAFGYLLVASSKTEGIKGIDADLYVKATRVTVTGKERFALTLRGTPTSSVVVDSLGFHPAATNGILLADGYSGIVRKYSVDAVAADMQPGGKYEGCGNGYDSGDYQADFVPVTACFPRSSLSPPGLPPAQ